jgi:hypothetical protein
MFDNTGTSKSQMNMIWKVDKIFMSNVVTILHISTVYFNNINLKELKYVCRVIIFLISIYWYEIKDSFFFALVRNIFVIF